MGMPGSTPKGYGGYRRDPEQVRRDGWQELQIAVIFAR